MDGLADPAWHMEEIRKVVGDDLIGMTAAVHVPAMLTYQGPRPDHARGR